MPDPQLLYKVETTGRSTEPESTAALALEMVHQTAQHGVLASTPGTMVDLLLMGRAAEMLIQAGQGVEPILAKITAKVGSIPGSPGGDIARLGLMIVVPSDLLVGEDVVWIDLTAVLIDLLTIDTG